jgi:hypothetical protein
MAIALAAEPFGGDGSGRRGGRTTMSMRTGVMAGVMLVAALLGGAALAQGAPPPLPSRAALAAQAAKRFPQPVRAGELAGRTLLQPIEAQPVLGRVETLARAADGGVDAIVRTGTVLGFGGRLVAVPVEAVALLGEYVALTGYTPAQLEGLDAVARPAGLPPGETVGIGLIRPFH